MLQTGLLVHCAQSASRALIKRFTMKYSVDFIYLLHIITSVTLILPLIDLRLSTSVPVAHAYAAYDSGEAKSAKPAKRRNLNTRITY